MRARPLALVLGQGLGCTPGPAPRGHAAGCDGPAYGGLVPDADAVHVLAGAPTGGAGSVQAPLRGLQAGVAAAVERGARQVLLGAGAYRGGVWLGPEHDGLHIAGLCPKMVRVGSDADEHVAFWVHGEADTQVHLSGMEVVDNPRGAVFVESGRAAVSALRVQGVQQAAFIAQGADAALELADVRVAGVLGVAEADPAIGLWLVAADGGQVVAQRLWAQDAQGAGLFVTGAGTRMVVQDSTLQDVHVVQEDRLGYGGQVDLGAELVLEDTTLSGTDALGLSVGGLGTRLELRRVLVQDAGANPAAIESGFGVSADTQSLIEIEDSTIAGTVGAGLHLSGAQAELDGLRIEGVDTVQTEDGPIAYGLFANDGAVVQGSGLTIQDTTSIGLTLTDGETRGQLADLVVQRIERGPLGNFGSGVQVMAGAQLTLQGAVLDQIPYVGLVGDGANSRIEATGLEVMGVGGGQSDRQLAAAVQVQDGAQLALEEGWIHHSQGAGLVVIDGGAHADLRDVWVQDMLGDVSAEWGRGIVVQGTPGTNETATLVARDVRLERVADVGIGALGGAQATLEDVVVLDTRREGGIGTCVGLTAQYGARILGQGVTVEGTEGPGMYTVIDGEIDCSDCVLRGNAFAGAVAFQGAVRLTDTRILGTVVDANEGGGVGVFGTAKVGPPTIVLDRVEIGVHPLAAVWLVGSGRYQIRDSVLAGGPAWPVGNTAVHGNGLMAIDGVQAWDPAEERGLWLRDTEIAGAEQVGAFFHDATGTLDGAELSDNGTDVWQQDCSEGLPPPAGLDPDADTVICPEENTLIWPIDYEIFLAESAVAG